MIFVWLATQSGRPEPQLWNDEGGVVVGKPTQEPIAKHRLSPDESGLSLDKLARRYPPPMHKD